MAINGHIVLEDTEITFYITDKNTAEVKVRDNFTCDEETYECAGPDFMLALGIALSFDGEASPEDYVKAESVQPKNPDLRFIP